MTIDFGNLGRRSAIAALTPREIHEVVLASPAEKPDCIRVADNEGEGYLYSASCVLFPHRSFFELDAGFGCRDDKSADFTRFETILSIQALLTIMPVCSFQR